MKLPSVVLDYSKDTDGGTILNMNISTNLFRLGQNDLIKGLVMAVLAGFLTPFIVAIQSPDFSIFAANWEQLLGLAQNGAVIGLVSYLVKNFFSDDSGKVFGKI